MLSFKLPWYVKTSGMLKLRVSHALLITEPAGEVMISNVKPFSMLDRYCSGSLLYDAYARRGWPMPRAVPRGVIKLPMCTY